MNGRQQKTLRYQLRCAPGLTSLAAAVLSATLAAGPALAGAPAGDRGQTAAPQVPRATLGTTLDWNVPAQPLDAALGRVEQLTGLTMSMTTPLPDGTRSRAIRGRMTVQAALDAMLEETNVTWYSIDERSIGIQPLSFHAEPVVVTASGFEQITRNAPASITVLGSTELQQRRYSSLAHALVDVEGVDIDNAAGKTGGLNISLRGMPSDYTLVLIDGRRQNAPGNVTPNGFTETSTSFMPPLDAIERIEVVRGPMSTLYGSDAMGGVVNIITRRIAPRWSGSATVDGTLQEDTSFGNTANGTFYLNGPIVPDRLGVALRGSAFTRRASDLTYLDEQGNVIPIAGIGGSPGEATIRTAGLRLTATPHANHDLTADFDGAWQRYDNSTSGLGTVDTPTRIGGYLPEQKYNRRQAVLAHAWRLPVGVIDSDLTRNTTETIGRTIPFIASRPDEAGKPRLLEGTNTIFNTKLVAARGAHTLTVGGQLWAARMVDGVAEAPFEFTQNALFAEDEWRLIRPLAVTLGVRHDVHSTFGGKTSPRAYLVWNLSPRWTVKGGVSRGFKTPRLEQIADGINGFGGQGRIPMIGSPSLRPETSTSTEAGVHYSSPLLAAGVTFFNNEFQDKIARGEGIPNCSFAASPDRPGCVDYGYWPDVDTFGQSINVDEAVTRGVESTVRVALGPQVTLTANYTFTESEIISGEGVGGPLVNTPKHMTNANLRWQATAKLSTWLRAEARSSRDRGTSAAALQLGPYRAYEIYHLGAAYDISQSLTINATVYNLLNRDFLRYLPYQATDGSLAYQSAYSNHQEPRRFWLSANLKF
jgi:outer membrane receptor for ferrienterochelin and colicins